MISEYLVLPAWIFSYLSQEERLFTWNQAGRSQLGRCRKRYILSVCWVKEITCFKELKVERSLGFGEFERRPTWWGLKPQMAKMNGYVFFLPLYLSTLPQLHVSDQSPQYRCISILVLFSHFFFSFHTFILEDLKHSCDLISTHIMRLLFKSPRLK